MKKLTAVLYLTLSFTLVSEGARADCSKLILPPDTVTQEKKIAIVRVSEINLRSRPGVTFCRFRHFGEGIQWKEVPVIGRHRTWRLVIMDGQKGWVHHMMFDPKTL
tara:strand:+ start:1146 stop:1463 length:318 start_codon:yes stop_codon:yes gene_type:complete